MAEAHKSGSSRNLLIIAAVVAVVAVIGAFFYFALTGGSGEQISAATATTGSVDTDVSTEELMTDIPLPDEVVGDADAPVTIVEYASMTCPHCADFHENVLPELKSKYIDTGKVKLIFREFPLDFLAAKASMLARCAGNDRYMPMVSALFETQRSWAVRDEAEANDRLFAIARQAGMSRESFDKCMADKALYEKIVQQRARAANDFGVNSTPSFFINGKMLGRSHQMEDFEKLLDGGDNKAEAPEDGS